MYIPEIFKVTDTLAIEKFIRENGFATLISKGANFPVGTHIPLELDINKAGEKVLWGHISKANMQGKDIEDNPHVLAVFLSSLHGYISSSWYTHENAPTWNYMSVHVSGIARIMDSDTLWESVSRLTDKYEKNSEHPVSLARFSKETQRQMQHITGIEIRVEKMEAAFKLSQNHSDTDFAHVLQKLREREDVISHLLADAMETQRTRKG